MATLIRPLILALCLFGTTGTQAKKIYKYTDANGVTHFTDQKPATDAKVEETVVKIEQQRMVELRVEGHADERRARAFNRLAGPTEVELSVGDIRNVSANPTLPLTVVMGPMEERVLVALKQEDLYQPAGFALSMRAVPGDPKASPEDVEYRWPLGDASASIGQGFNGSFSHTDEQSRYAIDIGSAEGTPVLAARDGVVMEVQDDYYGVGLDREKFATRANVVRVVHRDGSMAVYAHLKPESVQVQAGRHVYPGQKLGESGNTGFSTGPHLHFAVQVNRGMRLVSIPFRLTGPNGPIEIPTDGTATISDQPR
ncbi:peptidoglycan DD-metalloendopeptidase family protein [Tahibacter amnicola]|uniref:Peptidoglycan DD-metalloendopeptidase family protein n=1 Tax=Tahibacter amnicola TaxID=2976241 RepID=A0ABY6BC42_9GAMM|nr:peptidoglycan DD-metalloendopeptidase family protein [Tahibacter amnicola]UXI67609.1 peptidoglycan DD-metalloendopeptidase family protein [Tahibacter amnicola]